MTRCVNSPCVLVEAQISTLSERVSKKDTGCGTLVKFVGCVWTEPREAGTAEDAKLQIVWWLVKQLGIRRDIGSDRRWQAVNQVKGCRKGIRPVARRNGCLMEERETCFDNVTVFSFRDAIMLRSMWWRCEMRDSMCREKLSESNKFATIVRIQRSNLCLKPVLNQCLKRNKGLADLRFPP